MTEGKATTPRRFWSTANEFGFTFNWGYISRKATAYFTSGLLPRRPRGLDRRLPTLGTGRLRVDGLPQRATSIRTTSSGPGGLLLNWNNRSAPGFMHGDDEPYGSVQRVELFDQWPKHARITDNVGIMNRAATEDVRSLVWPVVSRVLHTGPAPSARDQQVVDILDDWVGRDAPRLDANGDGALRRARAGDHGPALAADRRRRHVAACSEASLADLNACAGLGSSSGESYVDKDLRTLLGEAGAGSLQPLLLRRRLSGRRAGARSGARSIRPPTSSPASSASPTRRSGRDRRPAPASSPGCCRTRSRRPTGRPSSRCSSCSATAIDRGRGREEILR